ncbi:hypothetical protein MBANPS3_010124 [Mucor bainieri]
MVFFNLKNRLVSLASTVVYQVCSVFAIAPPSLPVTLFPAFVATSTAVQNTLPARPVYRAYGFLEELYHPKFQFAKDADYCLVEEFRKIPIQTEYKTEKEFDTVDEAKAALATDLLQAYRTPLPGMPRRQQVEYKSHLKFASEATSAPLLGLSHRNQVSAKVSCGQPEAAANEDDFELINYPYEPIQSTTSTLKPQKKKDYLKSLKSKAIRRLVRK